MALLASCPDCRKKYRVPHAEREWRCKVCDVPLELEEPEEPEEEAPARSKAEQKVAAVKMRKAMGRVRILRAFLFLAMLAAVVQLLIVVGFAWSGRVPLGIGALALAWCAVNVGLVQLAIHSLERRPFPVTLSLASLATLSAAIQ